MFICRHCILCKKYQYITCTHGRRPGPCSPVVEFLFFQMLHPDILDSLDPGIFPVFFFCIHDQDFFYGIGLSLQPIHQSPELFIRFVYRYDHCHCIRIHRIPPLYGTGDAVLYTQHPLPLFLFLFVRFFSAASVVTGII